MAKSKPTAENALPYFGVAFIALVVYGLILLATAISMGALLPWWFWVPSLLMCIFFGAILVISLHTNEAVAELEKYTGYRGPTAELPPKEEDLDEAKVAPYEKEAKEVESMQMTGGGVLVLIGGVFVVLGLLGFQEYGNTNGLFGIVVGMYMTMLGLSMDQDKGVE